MSTLITTLGGRRFLLALLCEAGNIVLCWIGRLDGNAYWMATATVIGAYVAANTTQKIKAPGAPDPEPEAKP